MILKFIQSVIIWPITCLVFVVAWPFVAIRQKIATNRAYAIGFSDGMRDSDFNISQFDRTSHQKAYDDGYKSGSEYRA